MTTYTISELAKEFDITPRAIRFYEDQGLIAPQREGSRRVYTGQDRTRLKLTLRGKRLGFTLQEIKEMVDMYESPQDTVPQVERFLAKLVEQRQLLEQQREDLEITLSEIANFEQQCKRLLAGHEAAAAKTRKAAGAAPKRAAARGASAGQRAGATRTAAKRTAAKRTRT